MLNSKGFLLLLSCSALFGRVCAQDTLYYAFEHQGGKAYYERIFEVEGKSKSQLYTLSKLWGLDAFTSQRDVLQLDDKETGIIAYKYFIEVPYPPPSGKKTSVTGIWEYWQVMKIYLKDGKVKVTVENIQLSGEGISDQIPVETYWPWIEKQYLKYPFGKRYAKEFRPRVYENFSKANLKIISIISNLKTALLTNNSQSDF